MHDIKLPHHRLKAYEVALGLLEAVKAARIRDAYLRDHAMRSAKGAALNAAEGAGRVTRADKARAFSVARAEASEAASSVEIAVRAGEKVYPGTTLLVMESGERGAGPVAGSGGRASGPEQRRD